MAGIVENRKGTSHGRSQSRPWKSFKPTVMAKNREDEQAKLEAIEADLEIDN